MKRSKVLALVGAGLLTMGIVGVALATELQENQAGQTLGDLVGGVQVCDDFEDLGIEIGEGEVGVHFILTQPEAASGELDAVFSTDTAENVANTPKGAGALHFYVVITGDLDTVIVSATTDVDGDNLVVSHVCGGETTTTTTTTDTTTTDTTTTDTFTSSQQSTTDSSSSSTSTTDTFTSSQGSTTTQPPTDTLGDSGSGQQSSGLWLLLAALGVLAGSVIVLAPSKAKSRD